MAHQTDREVQQEISRLLSLSEQEYGQLINQFYLDQQNLNPTTAMCLQLMGHRPIRWN